jgi:citrate lyase subunit beta/citryl-CoA lyase
VTLEPRRTGGIALAVRSKVEPYYGAAIDEQLRAALKALGLRNARVELDDAGALPFVIAARLEAAARRAGITTGDVRPPRLAPDAAPTARDRRLRSRLYVPGAEPKFMVNAGLYGADGVILDLEDSVHPAEKDAARLLVRNALCTVDFGGAERMVRINQLPLGLADLDAIVPEGVDLVLIPKVESREQVREVAARVATVARRASRRAPVWLMPILESALGIENAFAIARAHPTVVALTIGLEDYTADLGVVKTPEGAETDWARRRLVNAAKAAGIQAIDSVYGDIADLEGLRAWALRSRAMGFEGMGCVHPRQIPVIHDGFAPTVAELEKAARIVAAFEEAQARGLGVVSLGSKMIDPPVVKRALALVGRAKA